jgi:hypothetical protein
MTNALFIRSDVNMLFFGIGLIVFGVVYICMGRAYARFHGWIYRADDPKGFWCEVGLFFVLGAGFIASALYEILFSN